MAPRKLSNSDKSDIIELYQQPNQTTSTLAEKFGVSNSTISRILKTTLPPEDYSALIAQKRMASAEKAEPKTVAPAKKVVQQADADSTLETQNSPEVSRPKLKSTAEKDEAKKTRSSRRRRSSSRNSEPDEQLPLLGADVASSKEKEAPLESLQASQTTVLPPSLLAANGLEIDDDDDDDDDLLGLDETLGDDFGDDDDDLEDDDDDEEEGIDLPKPKLQATAAMSIMPLGEAVLPKPCYLVVDMRSELITRPLSDFADLGQIPSNEEKANTLPVFDNHRVARRFSRNKQRVIKVPDGDLITRTSPYLQAKGITRLLVDGQVFDLSEQ